MRVAAGTLAVLACALLPVAAPAQPGGAPPGQAKKQAAAQTAPAAARPVAAPAPTTGKHSKKAAAPGHARRARAAAPAPAAAPTTATARPQTSRTRRPARRVGSRLPAARVAPRPITHAAAAVPTRVRLHRAAQRHARHKPQASAPKPRTALSGVTRDVTHTVRSLVRVVPTWAKSLIAALAALLVVAALLAASAARRSRRFSRQRAALAEQVGVLQAALLPEVPARLGALAVSVAYRPAEGLAAGGDFYDVFALDRGRVGVVVGDVSGHGRESLGPAAAVRHMLRSYMEAGLQPRPALQLAGKVIDDHKSDEFATVIAAIHDPSAGTLSYATAGHPPPIFAGTVDHEPLTVASSPPLGVGAPSGLRQTTLPLPPGGVVCLFTDGLVEARCGNGIFGLPRLQRVVSELGPGDGADELVERVAREANTLPDDIAVCLVRADGGVAAGTVRVEEIEVTADELRGERLERFLKACGLDDADVAGAIEAAAAAVALHDAVVLRVRLAAGRSGVDLLAADERPAAAALAPIAL
ncbi:MAG: PP2C family protein-serine/threonine phosphatase [Thermoleophilaceae bacterium]